MDFMRYNLQSSAERDFCKPTKPQITDEALFVAEVPSPRTARLAPRLETDMDRLEVMRLFVRIAETGSFSRAARAAGVGQPTASKQIALLEERLGARLLQRTSRRLNLTDEGQAYSEASVRLLGEVHAAESAIGRGAISPAGVVRVALSAGFGRMFVVPRLPEFFARYQDLAVDVNVSERHVNLIEDGLDVAIRIGFLADSTLLARRIGSIGGRDGGLTGISEAFWRPQDSRRSRTPQGRRLYVRRPSATLAVQRSRQRRHAPACGAN
jgi:molybdenum-dependent DNA-binding transcriptional regulator ModE